MKMYQGKCSICGGSGMGFPDVAYSYSAVHTDPNVCRYYLDQKAEELKEKEDS
ncbi:hypothetical protein LCGC14_0458640 [marine sediment metagenome]|uniref:Uncharacterized protein n=1 Tax=marine sediment metagenome TaxID=412755 RepID=A0A0F9V2H7_9ZZZZ